GGHAADEAGGAEAALGAAAHRHLVLDRVQGGGRAQTLGGYAVLAVEPGGRGEAGVDGDPLGRPGDARTGYQDRAGAALPLGAAVLAAGDTATAQTVQRRRMGRDAGERHGLTVDGRNHFVRLLSTGRRMVGSLPA